MLNFIKSSYAFIGYLINLIWGHKKMFSGREFWSYSWGIVFKPVATLKKIAAEAMALSADCISRSTGAGSCSSSKKY
jgi:hypothetical protein